MSFVSFDYWQYLTQKIISFFWNAFPFPWLLWHFTVLVIFQCHIDHFQFPHSFCSTCPLNVNISQGSLQVSCPQIAVCAFFFLVNAVTFSESFRVLTLKSSNILSSPSLLQTSPKSNLFPNPVDCTFVIAYIALSCSLPPSCFGSQVSSVSTLLPELSFLNLSCDVTPHCLKWWSPKRGACIIGRRQIDAFGYGKKMLKTPCVCA